MISSSYGLRWCEQADVLQREPVKEIGRETEEGKERSVRVFKRVKTCEYTRVGWYPGQPKAA